MPVFEQGYQHWQGTLGGYRWRWLAVARHGIRVGMKNGFVRRLLFAAWLPALMLAGVVCLWGMAEDPTSAAGKMLRSFKFLRDLAERPLEYRGAAWTIAFHMFLKAQMYILMVLVLLVGPTLISEDLRYNALPLYFSRPVRRLDYFVGKLAVVGFFLAGATVVPAVAAWVLGVLFSLDPRVIVDTARLLLAMIAYGLIVTLSAGLLILALSSLTRSSRTVAIIWAGTWLITLGVSNLLVNIHRHQTQRRYFADPQATRKEAFEIERKLGRHGGGPHDPVVPVALDPQERLRLQDRLDVLRREEARMWNEGWAHAQQDYERAQHDDWRPLLSYTANLERLGFALLGSRAAWEKVDELRGARGNSGSSLASEMTTSYPWYWSAFVLLGLAGLSVWILNRRVRSLDRLR